MRTLHSQRGWVGLIVLLIALVIVGMLSQKLFKQMGLFPDDRVISKTAGPRGPESVGAVPIDATSATPSFGNAIERAKGVEGTVQQQSREVGQRIDAQTK